MKANDQCDVCGKDVPPGEGHREELSAGASMCPTPMAFHDQCWELAKDMWQPDQDSLCVVDPMFPETSQWSEAQAKLDR